MIINAVVGGFATLKQQPNQFQSLIQSAEKIYIFYEMPLYLQTKMCSNWKGKWGLVNTKALFFKFSPFLACCQPSSPLILAGLLCPELLGCEEPGWRWSSPRPEPEALPVWTSPCRGTAEEIGQGRQDEMSVVVTPVVLKSSSETDSSCLGLGVLFRLCLVVVTISLGLIYASQHLAGGPQETWRTMLICKGKWATG